MHTQVKHEESAAKEKDWEPAVWNLFPVFPGTVLHNNFLNFSFALCKMGSMEFCEDSLVFVVLCIEIVPWKALKKSKPLSLLKFALGPTYLSYSHHTSVLKKLQLLLFWFFFSFLSLSFLLPRMSLTLSSSFLISRFLWVTPLSFASLWSFLLSRAQLHTRTSSTQRLWNKRWQGLLSAKARNRREI